VQRGDKMDSALDVLIDVKKSKLEYLLENRKDLQDREIINCSKELDKLILEYHKVQYPEAVRMYNNK
jgi:hypothetical protein